MWPKVASGAIYIAKLMNLSSKLMNPSAGASREALVSIVIPAYNAAQWIAAAVDSALGQSWPHVEVIVCDDGSTDATLEVLGHYRDSRLRVISQPNRGPCSAYNAALRLAQGDYIQYLDADDILALDKIEIQIRRLREEPYGTIASSAWSRFYDDDLTTADFAPGYDWRDYDTPTDWLVQSWSGHGMMPNFSWLTPRALSEAAGLWDEDVRINLDGEYFSRVLVHARKIAFCPAARGYYRSGLPTSNSNKRTPAKLQALYHTSSLCERTLLNHLDTRETRRACAGLWQVFLFAAYPRVPELTRLAERRVKELGGMYRKPDVSRPLRLVCGLLGWKAALRLQRIYRRSGVEELVQVVKQIASAPLHLKSWNVATGWGRKPLDGESDEQRMLA